MAHSVKEAISNDRYLSVTGQVDRRRWNMSTTLKAIGRRMLNVLRQVAILGHSRWLASSLGGNGGGRPSEQGGFVQGTPSVEIGAVVDEPP
jgi:hypothetical protein